MKRKLFSIIVIITCLFLVSCGSSSDPAKDFTELKQGDDVSIVGQVANSTLVNGNTLWVQVQQPDKTFILYHCQLKDDFISKGEELQIINVVKVRGLFLSLVDFETEETMPLITLYDCEILD